MTDDVSRVAALWARTAVEGDAVEMGRLWDEEACVDLEAVECFDDEEGEREDVGGLDGLEEASERWVWMRVLTTSKGVVMTPAMPPAVAAVSISSGRPMLFDPTYRLAKPRSSS